MLTQASVVGVIAIGMTFVIATAGIDLSVGSIVAAAGVFGGVLVGTNGGSLAVHLRRDRLRDPARHGQRRRDRLRAGGAVHRHARDVLDRARGRAAPQRQVAGEPARPQRGLVRRPGALLAALVRHRPDLRDPGLRLRLHRDHHRRLGRAQPNPLRPLRRGRGRQPRGGAHRRRPGAAGHLQRLRAVGPAGRRRGSAAVRPAGQRLAGQRQPLRARRHRRRRHRRHQPRGRPGHHRRDVPRRPDLRTDLQPHDPAEPRDRGPAGGQGLRSCSARCCSRGRRPVTDGDATAVTTTGGMECRASDSSFRSPRCAAGDRCRRLWRRRHQDGHGAGARPPAAAIRPADGRRARR